MTPGDRKAAPDDKKPAARPPFDEDGDPARLTKRERDAVQDAALAKVPRSDPRRWKLEELQALIKYCRDAGVRSFSGEGVEFSFERPGRKDDGGI